MNTKTKHSTVEALYLLLARIREATAQEHCGQKAEKGNKKERISPKRRALRAINANKCLNSGAWILAAQSKIAKHHSQKQMKVN